MDESVILNDERISILRILKNLFSRLVHGMHELKRKCTVRTFEQNGTDFLVTVKASQASTITLQRPFFLFWWTFHTIIINLTALQRPSLALQENRSTSSLRNTSEDFGYP